MYVVVRRLRKWPFGRGRSLTKSPRGACQDLLWKMQVNEEVKLLKRQQDNNHKREEDARAAASEAARLAEQRKQMSTDSSFSLNDELAFAKTISSERQKREQVARMLQMERSARLKAQERVRF